MSRQAIELARWSASSGSGARSRASVVLASDEHQWEASATGDGPVAALLRAIERALQPVLGGRPRLVSYDARILGEGHDPETMVRVSLMAAGSDETGPQYQGQGRAADVLAASARAYIAALNAMLADPAWAGAIASAGNRRRAHPGAVGRAHMDPDHRQHEIDWFPH